MSASVLRRPSVHFLFAASAVLVLSMTVLRSAMFAREPEIAAYGVTFDLTITIPLLYWFFIVRAGRAHAITIAPVFIACLFLASRIIPSGHQQFLRDLKLLVFPLEILVLWAVLTKRAIPPRVARIIQSELAILRYALFSWRKQPEPVDGRAVTFHERSGWGTFVAAMILLIAAEGVAMHLFLTQWSSTAAWAWTALDLWGAMWLIGDYHALRLRRSYLTPDTLHIRLGLRWSADIPLSNIASIDDAHGEWKRKDVLKLAMLDEPRYVITLREPVIVEGIAGITKEVRAIALLPDDDEFAAALSRVIH